MPADRRPDILIVMADQMVPSALPVILSYAQLITRLEAKAHRLALIALFVAAYLLVWSAFGVLAGAANWLLARTGLLSDSAFSDPRYAGALLVTAGLYQWSPSRACASPAATYRQASWSRIIEAVIGGRSRSVSSIAPSASAAAGY